MSDKDIAQELSRFRDHCEEIDQMEVAELAHDATCEIGRLRARLQRAEELLKEVKDEIDYRYDDEEELVAYKERIDAFLGGHHDD